MKRQLTIHRSLLVSVSLAILLLSTIVLSLTAWTTSRLVQALSQSVIDHSLEEIDSELHRFFDPARTGLSAARAWGRSGVLALEPAADFNQLMQGMLVERPQLAASILANELGQENLLRRVDQGWSSRQLDPQRPGEALFIESLAGDSATEEWRPLNYDPRQRPWYLGAMGNMESRENIHWTAPYKFYTGGLFGITAATAFRNPQGQYTVVAFDVLLDSLSDFTRSIKVGQHGKVFVITDENQVIGLPGDPRFDTEEEQTQALLKAPDKLGIPIVGDATLHLTGSQQPNDQVKRFISEREFWWGGIRSFPLAENYQLTMMVVIPESDLLGNLAVLRWWIIIATVAVLVFALWRAHRLAQRYSQPIQTLAIRSHLIGLGDLSPVEEIDSNIVEINRMRDSLEQMRGSLGTLLKLEHDLQLARQIQQNTFPEKLPELAGYELEAWSEPADETGGDTYDLIEIPCPEGSDEPCSQVMLLLADATGHGIGPALSVTQLRSMLRMAVRSHQALPDMIREINEQLHADLTKGRFITAWFGQLDRQQHRLTGFSAGQAPLLHYIAAEQRIAEYHANSPPLGIIDGLDVSLPPPLTMSPGDIFAAISDGFLEARNDQREQYGVERANTLLLKECHRPAAEILTMLREEVKLFTNNSPAEDDCTAVIIKRN